MIIMIQVTKYPLSKFIKFFNQKRWTLLSIAIIVPLGFYSKIYTGLAAGWVNNSLGGVLYVIFWSLLFSICFIRPRAWKIAVIVLLTTCLLEFLQLWHPPFLQTIRSTFLGVSLIGNSFSWSDQLHYVIGFILSGILITLFNQHKKKSE